MRRLFPLIFLTAWLLAGAEFAAADLEFFEKKIRPLLAEHCYKCHGAKSKKLKGGLRLDHSSGVLKGADSGAAFVSGNPEQSRLIKAVGYDNVDLEMPPSGKLTAAQIADLTKAQIAELQKAFPKSDIRSNPTK